MPAGVDAPPRPLAQATEEVGQVGGRHEVGQVDLVERHHVDLLGEVEVALPDAPVLLGGSGEVAERAADVEQAVDHPERRLGVVVPGTVVQQELAGLPAGVEAAVGVAHDGDAHPLGGGQRLVAQRRVHLVDGGDRVEADIVDRQRPRHVQLGGEAVVLGRHAGHLRHGPEHRRAGRLEHLDIEDLGVGDHVDGGAERDEPVGGVGGRAVDEADGRGGGGGRGGPATQQAHQDRCSSSASIHSSAERRAAVTSSRTTSPCAPPTG